MSLFNGPINNITFINTNHNILLQLLRKKNGENCCILIIIRKMLKCITNFTTKCLQTNMIMNVIGRPQQHI